MAGLMNIGAASWHKEQRKWLSFRQTEAVKFHSTFKGVKQTVAASSRVHLIFLCLITKTC